MPFPVLISSGFTAKEDSAKFSVEPIDQSIQYETEGGVFLSRPRNTRDPGEIITTGFTDITDSDYNKLLAFYKQMRGGSDTFTYVHPVSEVNMTVRFHKPFKAKYSGAGIRKRWDINDLTLRTL